MGPSISCIETITDSGSIFGIFFLWICLISPITKFFFLSLLISKKQLNFPSQNRGGLSVSSLSYRINSPVFVGGNIQVQGIKDEEVFKFWIKDSTGKKAFSSTAIFKD